MTGKVKFRAFPTAFKLAAIKRLEAGEAVLPLARKLGVSRSELYARALERLLRQEPDLDVTNALEAIYSADDSSIDRPLAAAQRRATAEKW